MSQPARRYVSEVRDEQARRTRRAVVTAARELFLAQGYAATTIDAIAEAAHVSRRTVFNAVGGKLALLKLRNDLKQQQGKAFSLKSFHDTLLAQGTAPFWLHRQLMLGDDAGDVIE